jgi:hypothetical protein
MNKDSHGSSQLTALQTTKFTATLPHLQHDQSGASKSNVVAGHD